VLERMNCTMTITTPSFQGCARSQRSIMKKEQDGQNLT
jgi:hypothetical protein